MTTPIPDKTLEDILQTDDNLMDITKPVDDAFLMSRSQLMAQLTQWNIKQKIELLESIPHTSGEWGYEEEIDKIIAQLKAQLQDSK